MNKDSSQWVNRPVANRPLVNQSLTTGQSVRWVLVNRPDTKETITKETNTKENIYICILEKFNKANKVACRMTAKKRAMIRARLKVFSVEEISAAIENRAGDAFMCGDNPARKEYRRDFVSLFRNDEQIERWLNRKKVNPMDLIK